MTALQKSDGQTGATPGPWVDGNEAIKVMADRSKPWNGTVFQEGVEDKAESLVALTFGATVEECVETARLIAAAPELLEALLLHEEAQKALDDADEHGACAEAEGWRNDPTGSCWVSESYNAANRLFEQAREKRLSAIAKATGASS